MADSESNNLGLTLSDLEFVVEETGPSSLDPARLKQIVREDPSFRNALVRDDKVFNRVVSSDDEELLRISPVLYFEVLLRRALKDLGRESHTLERSGRETVVIFDTNEVTNFLSNDFVIDYLANMMTSFTKVESYVIPVRIRRGTWRRVRFNDMDIDSLVKLAGSVDESQQFRYFKRIADVCLFILGIFPNFVHNSNRNILARTKPFGTVRRGRRTAEEYVDIGKQFYRTAGDHRTADAAGLVEPLHLLRDNFGVAQKILNIISERYMHFSRSQVFDVGLS